MKRIVIVLGMLSTLAIVSGCSKKPIWDIGARFDVVESKLELLSAVFEANQKLVTPTETLGIDFNNASGGTKAMTNFGYVLIASQGSAVHGQGMEVHFTLVNPLAITLHDPSITFHFGKARGLQITLTWPITLMPGRGKNLTAVLTPATGEDITSVQTTLDFQSIGFN